MKTPENEKAVKERDLVRESVRLRGASPDKLVRSLDDLNGYILKSAIAGVKIRNPGINTEETTSELKSLFA